MARAAVPASKQSAYKAAVSTAFDEIKTKEPASVIATGKTGKAKRSMEIAIALSKGRRAVGLKG